MNNKFLVLYVSHFINDFSLAQFYKLKNELPAGYKLVWWLDDNCKDELIPDIEFIKFPHSSIDCRGYGWINPMKYMENYYLENEWFRNFDYYWIVEYDVYFNGNWQYFFETVDKYNEDLVCSALSIYKRSMPVPFFCGKNFYNHFDKILKSYISLYRISKKALEVISNYNESDIKSYLYEVYIPTILYKYNLTFLSLNKEKFILEDNNYQYEYGTEIKRITHYYDDTGFIDNAVNDFWWNATFYQKHEMNKPNKLFTRYK